MIDFEKFTEVVITQVLESNPDISEKFIKDEVNNMILLGKMDSRELATKYNHLCDNCGWCCKDTGCESFVFGRCSHGNLKPEICLLYPCYLADGENGIYPDPYCGLAVKIATYEILEKMR